MAHPLPPAECPAGSAICEPTAAAGAAGIAAAILQWLASPRWMLAFFAFAILSAVVAMEHPDWITAAWAVPLLVFVLSLLAAVATNRRFRRDAILLGLHLGLLAFVLLVAFARLTYLDGAVTLTQGTSFEGRLDVEQRGPLHPDRLSGLRFANEGFTEDFGLQDRWKATFNRVRWWDAGGASHVAEIGDDHPLLLGGYRIYTTRNRGYSPVFRWQSAKGREEIGNVQLRAGEFDMANAWQLPDGPEVWAMLALAEPAALERGERRPNLGAGHIRHNLIVRTGEQRHVLRPGESLDLPEGRLTYLALDSWMGYRLVYDPAMYWMAGTAAVVAACMIAFYARLLGKGEAGGPAVSR